MNIIDEDCNFILNNSPANWERLKNSRILLTGGTGYYGKWLLKSFLHVNSALALNAQAYVVSRSPEKFLTKYPEFAGHNLISFIKDDVRSFHFPPGRFDYIIHAATEVATSQEKDDPDGMISVAKEGTQHVLDFANISGAKRLLLTSSGAIYGTQPQDLCNMPETYQGTPDTVYGKAKKISEKLCLASGINCAIARCYASVGPWLGLDIQYAVGNFIRNLLNNEPIIIKSDGRPRRSYLYTADLISWLWTILLNGKSGEAYNVGGDKPISIEALANLVAGFSDTKLPVLIKGEKASDSLPPRYLPDTTKIRTALGLTYCYTLSAGIRRTLDWHRHLI